MVKRKILVLLKAVIAFLLYVIMMVLGFQAAVWLIPVPARLIFLVNALCAVVFGMGTMWLLRRVWDRKTILSMGYQRRTPAGSPMWRELLLGCLAGAGLILLGLCILVWSGGVRISEECSPGDGGAAAIPMMFVCFIFVAVAEESCFRGYVLSNLMDEMNWRAALPVSGLIFSLPHLLNPNPSWMSFVNIILAGCFLGASYVFTRNLWFPTGLHLGWNFTQSAVGFRVSGLESPSLLSLEYPSDTLWNGGQFGFEASVPCTVLLVIATWAVIFLHSRRRSRSPEQRGVPFK